MFHYFLRLVFLIFHNLSHHSISYIYVCIYIYICNMYTYCMHFEPEEMLKGPMLLPASYWSWRFQMILTCGGFPRSFLTFFLDTFVFIHPEVPKTGPNARILPPQDFNLVTSLSWKAVSHIFPPFNYHFWLVFVALSVQKLPKLNGWLPLNERIGFVGKICTKATGI